MKSKAADRKPFLLSQLSESKSSKINAIGEDKPLIAKRSKNV